MESAIKSQTSADLPIFITICRSSITPPNRITPNAALITNFIEGRLNVFCRHLSTHIATNKPPNMIPCTTLSALVNKIKSFSPSGFGVSVRYNTTSKQTPLSIHAGSDCSIDLSLVIQNKAILGIYFNIFYKYNKKKQRFILCFLKKSIFFDFIF